MFDVVIQYSYLGIFSILSLMNAAPLLMPPTWIVLASFHAMDGSLDPLWLSVVGASGATLGRFALMKYSGMFRRFVGDDRRAGLDSIGRFLGRSRYGYALASFLFASTPLPSNMLFVTYGLMRASSPGLLAGFWCGRLISYYIMISISQVVLVPFLQLFEDRYTGIIVADVLGVAMVVLFASVDWAALLEQRKLRFMRPRIWRL